MSASDHLSPEQFMPVEKIGRMRSGNMNYDSWHDAQGKRQTRPATVADWNNLYRGGFGSSPPNDALDADIGARGIREPLEVGIATNPAKHDDVLYDGHHRYAAALLAGHTSVPVFVEPSYTTKPKFRGK